MEVKFKQWDCTIEKAQYGNGRIALRLMSTDDTQPDEVVIKYFSENEGMYQTLLNAGIITAAHRYTSSGWIEAIPISRLAVEL